MPRLLKMMRVLILLLLPMVAVGGGFEVCHEPICHESRAAAGCHGCHGGGFVQSCGEQGRNCSHHHRHEQIRFALDAGERPQSARLSVCCGNFSETCHFFKAASQPDSALAAGYRGILPKGMRHGRIYVLKC